MTNIVKRALISAVAVLGVIMPVTVSAYNQAEYTANGKPQFNAYSSVEGFGDERDFFRVGPVGGRGSQFSNEMEVCKGEAQLNVYVHNGAPEGYNGTDNKGTGVATNTRLNVQIPEGKNTKFPMNAVISADNAATVSNGATIVCNGKTVKLEYVKGSATITSAKRGTSKLSDNVVNGGTQIGTYADDGVVPGCWEFRIFVSMKVRVTEVKTPVTPEKPVTPTKPQPETLPNTGAGDVMGMVAVATIAGAIAHRLYVARRRSM